MSHIMEINDCEIETIEMNHQDMNSANKDHHEKQLDNFIAESMKSFQFSDGDYKMLSREIWI